MSYLFLVNIGPVQDFIAAARQTRDLYCGSWLLSDLARTVALQIAEENGSESLIFPAPMTMNDLKLDTFNVANKIVAIIEQSPQELAQCVEKKMRDRLDEIRGEAYRNIPLSHADQEMARKQIEDLIEFQWVALPYDEDDHKGGCYKIKREMLEALMAARKNTRNFQAVPWMKMCIPKSSIDGKLESVIPEDRYDFRRLCYEQKQRKISELYQYFKVGPAERLSGVDLLKRHATKPEKRSNNSSKPQEMVTANFEALSTSHMAALPFLKRLESIQEPDRTRVKKAWNDYIEQFKKISPEAVRLVSDSQSVHPILGRCDGGMLFEDQLIDMLHLPPSDQDTANRLQSVKTALRNFYQSIDDPAIHPNPYYALLQADGDSMGEAIDAYAQNGYKDHCKISQALSCFSKKVRDIVKSHQGALVYAGGDDVLAFLPLHTVLQCASKLAEQFREDLQSFTYQKNQKDYKPTLSVGIAIVHHLDTLKEARRLAKQAEIRAKEVNGKNALAITISKRSGGEYSIAGSWETKNLRQGIGDYLENLINVCRDDAIPDGTAYELRDLVLRLTASENQEEKAACVLQKVIKQGMRRILQRKLYVPVGKFPKEQAKLVEKFLNARLGIKEEQQDCEKRTTPVAINQFIDELIVAQTLAEARQLVEPKKGAELWQSGLLNHVTP
jgi:CRISPR-associated protein Cmr2